MRSLVSSLVLSLTAASFALTAAAPAATGATTGNSAPQTGRIVSEEPARTTPHILDGTVYSITEVGDQIVVGGSFTEVRNPDSSARISRTGVFAFDKRTGLVNPAFAPQPGGTVYKVQAAADGTSVYIGGRFTSVGGTAVRNLVRAELSSGALTPGFTPPNLSGEVRDLEVTGDRLWVAGKFTHINGRPQRALGTLNATTGGYDPYFTGKFAGLHNPGKAGSVTNVLQISTNPQNTQLVAVGNFTTVNDLSRYQIVKFDLGEAAYAVSTWSTTLFTSQCSRNFETYMTDVEYSPDGSFFVVSTSGAYGGYAGSVAGTSGCDVVARFEADSQTTSAATWTAYTGGDTTWTVEVTDDVVYAGGHQRWQNNPTRGDTPGQGAVERTGIAALNAVNGMPYSWNPTRARGVGVQDMLANEDGLYVGSDTTLIGKTPGNVYHARIALLPLSTGKDLPVSTPYSLPADVYTVAAGQSQLVRRSFSGTSSTPRVNAPNGPGWGSTVGAFMVNGVLYRVTSNGVVTKQTFDGTTYGTPEAVDAGDALVAQTDWRNGDIPKITSLFYDRGRVYFTRSDSSALLYRGFEVESDVVGQQRFSLTAPAGFNYTAMRGAFVADGFLYYADTSGALFRAAWTPKGPTGLPQRVSGPSVDGQNWTSRAMFPFQRAPEPRNTPPTASFTVSCDQLTCTFDGSASADPDGTIASYSWDFGDGTPQESGATVTHTYATPGDRQVRLTVTDNRGGSGSEQKTASPSQTANAIQFVGQSTGTSNGNVAHRVTVPAATQAGDTMLLLFTGSGGATTYSAPPGWTEVASESSADMAGRAFVRTATAADAGTVQTTGSGATVKSNSTLLVYRGVSADAPVTQAAASAETVGSVSHTTPTVSAADGSNWLVSYWSDESSATTSWPGRPGAATERATAFGTGGGRITSLTMDSDGPVSTGTQGALTAEANGTGKGMNISVLLKSS